MKRGGGGKRHNIPHEALNLRGPKADSHFDGLAEEDGALSWYIGLAGKQRVKTTVSES